MPSIKTTGIAEINNYWLLLHNSKKVFAPVNKNANTSIKGALQQGQEKTEFVSKDTVISDYGDYEIVAVSRNPFDRLVSCYEFFQKVQPQYNRMYEFPSIDSFETFIKEIVEQPDEISNKHYRSQYNLLSQDGIFLPDIVIDFNELDSIKDHLPIGKMGHKHKGNRGQYKNYYNQELRKLVEKRFWRDFDYFGYSF